MGFLAIFPIIFTLISDLYLFVCGRLCVSRERSERAVKNRFCLITV